MMGLRRVDLTKARRQVVTEGRIDGNSQARGGRRDGRKPLRGGGRSLIASPPSRLLLYPSPARVMVLFAVSTSCRNIWSGPEAQTLQGPQRAYA